MERRRFIETLFSALVLGGIFLLSGCGRKEKASRFGNHEKLWELTAAQKKIEEPVELAYSKNTPALYRDATMGKADPNFVPKLTGG